MANSAETASASKDWEGALSSAIGAVTEASTTTTGSETATATATATARSTGTGPSSPESTGHRRMYTFDNMSELFHTLNSGKESRVITTDPGAKKLPSFEWQRADVSVSLKKLELIEVMDNTTFKIETRRTLDLGRSPDATSDFFVDASQQGTKLDLSGFKWDKGKDADGPLRIRADDDDLFFKRPLAIRLSWEAASGEASSSSSGSSVSPLFAVLDDSQKSDELESISQNIISDFPDAVEDGFDTGPGDDNNSLPTSTDTGAGPVTGTGARTNTVPSATSSSGSNPTLSDGDGPGGGGGGGGGLSKGAIAGIVVGCVVGLALLALAIWFLVVRPRRRRARRAAAGGDRGHDLPMLATAHAKMSGEVDSPGTYERHLPPPPHQDEQDHGHSHSHLATAAPAAAVSPPPPMRSPSPGPQQQRESRSNYAHLVEEGMTEHDIRRLEEEERQLDDEIARSRAAR